jgi:hypothetical protein
VDELNRWLDHQLKYHDFDVFSASYSDMKDKIAELRQQAGVRE